MDLTGFSVAEYEQFKEGGIRALAVLSPEREPGLPDVPTAQEQGVDSVHGLMQFWWAPKGTPEDRLAYLRDLLARAMETPSVQERLNQLHMEPVFETGPELAATIQARGNSLEGIVIEKPPALPPVHWIVFGLVGVFGVWVWREGKPE